MALKISGKNFDIGQALRSRIETEVRDAVGKYFDGSFSGHVTIGKNSRIFETECALHLDTGIVFEARAEAPDATLSFDQAATRLEKRLRRYKRRLKGHKRPPQEAELSEAATFLLAPPAEEDEVADDYAPAIVAETRTVLRTLSVSAAVMELDRVETPVVVFRNQSHGGINVVYRRPDGHFGWIDPVLVDGVAAAGSG